MKIYERSLQVLLSSAPRSRVLARLALLAKIGEFARRLASNRGKDQEEWIADTIARADDNTHVTPAMQKYFLGSLSGS